MLLAFEGRNRSLMRHLASKLDGKPTHAEALAMIGLYDKPETVVSFITQYRDKTLLYQSGGAGVRKSS
ncbi:hypothetical protein ACT691_11560 [Vibrio metschnikovii]